jgi:predicted ABC-type transport system involved in lysophospholipase L1 biosynthesis ATPase subunit
VSVPLLSLRRVVKHYQALRPLRVEDLSVSAGEVVVLKGVDAAAAETFVALLTAATLPDEGAVELFGQRTTAIEDHEGWLHLLDGLGILTERAVLLEPLTVLQNAALPFTLEIEPVPEPVRAQVEAVLHEVGLARDTWDRAVAASSAEAKARVRLARAAALGPRLLVAEHPTAGLPRDAVGGFAADLAALARARGAALVAISADDAFAARLGGTVLTHEPKSGAFRKAGLLSRWF